MEPNERIRIGITQGDTNGVGYEVILKTFSEPTMLELCTPVIYGNPRIATYHRKGMGLTTNFAAIQSANEVQPDRLNMVVVDDSEVKIEMGTPSTDAGRQALLALENAVKDLREGKIDALVTAPVNKHSIQADNFRFPGHTEYIQDRLGEGQEALMILMNDRLRVALATTHLPISQVAQAITQETIVAKLRILHHSLLRDFSISAPRIAVLALNPHAGDNGLLGSEEQDILKPAIEQANAEGIPTFGPYAADGFFGARQYEHFDAVLSMYHDQGLTAFKALATDTGVNFTAGLPVVRTSPAHGTAYDIAGRGIADENSFRQAIFTATDICRNRRAYDEAHGNPLPKLFHDRREEDFRQRRSDRPNRFDSRQRENGGNEPNKASSDNAVNAVPSGPTE
ncbi:MAG: 4-hydroxythreonine-4-phosphate dehydrogenase PdxA [Bacteroidaceae bacterium]|nr:4-hydroxythreonine-4-phosphate dehydrogenase PdxA [Bacteroidaceae bacterium]MBR1788306.1 4-hydroxythreonine-4-phosphate dehydrogenase PdxA [Bacteroidaceae bacterium]